MSQSKWRSRRFCREQHRHPRFAATAEPSLDHDCHLLACMSGKFALKRQQSVGMELGEEGIIGINHRLHE